MQIVTDIYFDVLLCAVYYTIDIDMLMYFALNGAWFANYISELFCGKLNDKLISQ